ncbi:hypothetical protein BCR33DRAFT_190615 [Rhizoclosmatium globosum]|uniref:Uncharacterized protein n=1 Tax=Rhizoclosmatium globosum TaxID=329046 RepID=A0A1Y2D1P9_9FUNG|nr:hypothetical protein BCR33DRAFT_190615 [Rhizoclosmatium globosum]|eukprot:ORY53211.1 hypothetical protein BCR33DRAFT_190615 [Rhizoclosmatium globosum]
MLAEQFDSLCGRHLDALTDRLLRDLRCFGDFRSDRLPCDSRMTSRRNCRGGKQPLPQWLCGRSPCRPCLAVQKITASDVQASSVIKLKNIYAADNSPSVEYLRTARFVEALIKNVFGAEQTDNSMIDEKIWLLAYVASVRESWTEDNSGPIERNTDMLKPTIDSLHYAYTIFPKLTPDIDLRHEFKNLLDCVR